MQLARPRWIAENDVEAKQWFSDISAAIDSAAGSRAPSHSVSVLESLPTRSDAERLAAVANGSILMKYNQRDGSHALRYVCVRTAAGPGEERMSLAPGLPMKLCWGEVKKDFSAGALRSEMKLEDALALLHGAKSATFYKKARGVKREQDWLCFSLVFKERTLDFAATNAQALLDWYLGLAQLIPHSTEPLLDEPTLRGRIGRML